MSLLRQTVHCSCGKAQLAIDSPSALRLVCYCKDCRGYYNTLNDLARSEGKPPQAQLDEWGGVDMTQIYPSEVKVVEGCHQYLTTCRIREKSVQKLVYATCCDTPMVRIGASSALLNTNLLTDENKGNVRFRIMGRMAPKVEGPVATNNLDDKNKNQHNNKKPKLSWSVPLSFPFVMMRRIKKDLMTPEPLDTKDARVLENFKQG
jgi:Family of unknown function (DUF6151)